MKAWDMGELIFAKDVMKCNMVQPFNTWGNKIGIKQY